MRYEILRAQWSGVVDSVGDDGFGATLYPMCGEAGDEIVFGFFPKDSEIDTHFMCVGDSFTFILYDNVGESGEIKEKHRTILYPTKPLSEAEKKEIQEWAEEVVRILSGR